MPRVTFHAGGWGDVIDTHSRILNKPQGPSEMHNLLVTIKRNQRVKENCITFSFPANWAIVLLIKFSSIWSLEVFKWKQKDTLRSPY